MTPLYHGSSIQNLKTLEPRKRHTPQGKIDYAAIYASPLPGFAATHSFSWSTSEGVDLGMYDDCWIMTVPTSMRERLLVPISIYTCDSEGFTHTKEESTGYTWHTTQPVHIIEEKKYENVEVALKELGVELRYV